MLTIALGSQSAVKVRAVELVVERLHLDVKIIPVKASSSINEQPFEDETITGAENRALHSARLVPDADYTLAIESGLFFRSGIWLDIAVIILRASTGLCYRGMSYGVPFPEDAVEEVKRRGPDKWTVGQILEEWGRVKKHNDPHIELTGRSRADYLNDSVYDLFKLIFSD